MQGGLSELARKYRAELEGAPADFDTMKQDLDPTQKLMVEMLVTWADKRLEWRQALPAIAGASKTPPSLRLAVLGTAGTGKTHTAQVAIKEVRRRLKSYDSVVTMAVQWCRCCEPRLWCTDDR